MPLLARHRHWWCVLYISVCCWYSMNLNRVTQFVKWSPWRRLEKLKRMVITLHCWNILYNATADPEGLFQDTCPASIWRLLERTIRCVQIVTWWRHQIETFFALLALCAGNPPFTGEFPSQRPVTRTFDIFFDLRPNKRLSKQSWGWWFEAPSRPLCRHCNADYELTLL